MKNNKKYTFGIDLGTTNSVVSCSIDGKPAETLKDSLGREIIPSAIAFNVPKAKALKNKVSIDLFKRLEKLFPEGGTIVGYEALSLEEELDYPIFRSFKLYMGSSHVYDGVMPGTEEPITPFALSRTVLEFAKLRILNFLEGQGITDFEENTSKYLDKYFEVTKKVKSTKFLQERISEISEILKYPVCVTVPAYFKEVQKTATYNAAARAGLPIKNLIAEPTAAIIRAQKLKESRDVMVVDLGGGTLDISLVNIQGDKIVVVTTDGDHFLGGDNYTRELMDLINTEYRPNNLPPLQFYEVESIKKELATSALREDGTINTRALVQVEGCSKSLSFAAFNKCTWSLTEKVGKLIDDIFSRTGYLPEYLSEVVLVGGSTRLPQVRKIIAEKTQTDIRVFKDYSVEPDLSVSLGAADKLNMSSSQINDIINISISVLNHDGTVKTVLPRDAYIPFKNTEVFKVIDTTKPIIIKLYEGEMSEVDRSTNDISNLDLLGSLKIEPSPVKRTALGGVEKRVLVTLTVDQSGRLLVDVETEEGVYSVPLTRDTLVDFSPEKSTDSQDDDDEEPQQLKFS